jgi:UDP-glucose 4-epimerase
MFMTLDTNLRHSSTTPLEGKSLLITGGTGSLGKVLLRRVLSGELGLPRKVIIFSRDEGKQHAMRVEYMNKLTSTDEVIFNNFNRLIEFRIGSVYDYNSLSAAMAKADIVVNAAALKQVPTCEYFPVEAVNTNILGAENIVRAVRDQHKHIETVVGISTDKACMPVNVMGMTKAIQERVLLGANIDCPNTRFFAVRYGNVLASRGSVIPLFREQILSGGPVTITHPEMTRFLLSLNQAVDIIFEGLCSAKRGEIYVPIIPASKITHVASALIGNRNIEVIETGIRPGEKLHEVLISDEEAARAFKRGGYYVLPSALPELHDASQDRTPIKKQYDSSQNNLSEQMTYRMLAQNDLLLDDVESNNMRESKVVELLR